MSIVCREHPSVTLTDVRENRVPMRIATDTPWVGLCRACGSPPRRCYSDGIEAVPDVLARSERPSWFDRRRVGRGRGQLVAGIVRILARTPNLTLEQVRFATGNLSNSKDTRRAVAKEVRRLVARGEVLIDDRGLYSLVDGHPLLSESLTRE